MYLNGKYIHDLVNSDITDLIENEIRENQSLEYKRQLDLSSDKDKSRMEFICDIAAMYNSEGGCIVFGIAEKRDEQNRNTGIPESIFPFDIPNLDKLQQQMNDLVRANTDPVIAILAIKVLTFDESQVIVVGVPKGLGIPVMVTLNEVNKFYRRNNTGKYAVDTYELNNMFMQNQNLLEKAEAFKIKRVIDVRGLKVFPNLDVSNSFFLHVIPVKFLSGQIIDLGIPDWLNLESNIYPVIGPREIYRQTDYSTSYNYDGFYAARTNNNDQITAYNQFFRNGCIEVYASVFASYPTPEQHLNDIFLWGNAIITETVLSVQKFFGLMKVFQIEPPFLCMISLYNVGDMMLLGGPHGSNTYQDRITRNELDLPPYIFMEGDLDNGQIHQKLKPVFDVLWQSAGKPFSPKTETLFVKE